MEGKSLYQNQNNKQQNSISYLQSTLFHRADSYALPIKSAPIALSVSIWLIPLFCVFFYSHCVAGKKSCGGDASLDPTNNCLPFDAGTGEALNDESEADTDGALENENGNFGVEGEDSGCKILGNGTATEPYQICDYLALSKVGRSLPADAHYVLTQDIDASSDSEIASFVIGHYDEPFSGTFDGQGHVVSNISLDYSRARRVGLFGYVRGGTISNLGLVNVRVVGKGRVGALVGHASDAEISNIYVQGGEVSGKTEIGGLAGRSSGETTLTNVYSSALVSGDQRIGGLLGSMVTALTIKNGYSLVKICGSTTAGALIGEVGSDARLAMNGENYFLDEVGGTDGIASGSDGDYCADGAICERKSLPLLTRYFARYFDRETPTTWGAEDRGTWGKFATVAAVDVGVVGGRACP